MYSFIRLDGCVGPASSRHSAVTAPILDQLAVLSDAIRVRVLAVLEDHELTVSELCEVLQLPQSTVSRHLKTLADGGWVTSRREATSRALRRRRRGAAGRRPRAVAGRARPGRRGAGRRRRTRRRLARVLDARRADVAGVLRRRGGAVGPPARRAVRRRRRRPRRCSACSIRDWVVADLGLRHRPRRRRWSRPSCAASSASTPRRRCWRRAPSVVVPANVDLRQGTLEALPIGDAEVDLAPARAGAAPRARSGARRWPKRRASSSRAAACVVVDMLPHDREDYRQQHGPRLARLRRAADRPPAAGAPASTRRASCRWPPKPRPKGPSLFLAAARPRRRPVDSRPIYKEIADVRCRRHPARLSTPPARPAASRSRSRTSSLAEFGRKEIRLAEHEMPGLMALRARYEGAEAAGRRQDHGLAAHDGADRRAHRDAGRARRRRALGVVQHLLDAGQRRRRRRRRPAGDGRHGRQPAGHAGVRVEGRDARGYWWCTKEALVWPDGTRPEPDRR